MAKIVGPEMLQALPPHLQSWVHDARARGRSERTVHLYTVTAQQALAHSGAEDIDQFTTAGLRAYLAHRQATVSATTTSLEQRALSSMSKWMLREDLVKKDPMANIKVQRPPRKVRDILTVQELDTLIRMADGRTLDRRRDAALISMMSETGVRVGEAASMDLDHLDPVNRTIEVVGKTGPRLVPYGYRTQRLLDKWLRVRHQYSHAHESKALWMGDRGALTVDGIAQALNRASKRAGMPRVAPHDLRHAWAAAMKTKANLPDRVLETLGGWAPGSAMVRHYGRDVEVQQAIDMYRSPLEMAEQDRKRR